MSPEQAELLVGFLDEEYNYKYPARCIATAGETVTVWFNGVEIQVTEEKTNQKMIVSVYEDDYSHKFYSICPMKKNRVCAIISTRPNGHNGQEYSANLHSKESILKELLSFTCEATF